jgi:hypothetical protein
MDANETVIRDVQGLSENVQAIADQTEKLAIALHRWKLQIPLESVRIYGGGCEVTWFGPVEFKNLANHTESRSTR